MSQQRYARFYETSEYSRFRSVKRQDQAGVVDALLSHQDGHTLTDPATSDVVIGLTLAGTTPARWRVGSKWREIEARCVGHIGVSPLEEETDFDIPEPHTLLVLAINKSRLIEIQKTCQVDCIDLMSVGCQAYISDADCMQYAKGIWRALENPDGLTQIQVEGLVDALIGRLLVRYAGGDPRSPVKSEDIDLRHLEAFIRANMASHLTVAALAQVVRIEPAKFGRAFKAQTGMTPYQYVQTVRIAMACGALKSKRLAISELAFQLGFSDQSHLTRVFRKHMGMTPAQYQKHE